MNELSFSRTRHPHGQAEQVEALSIGFGSDLGRPSLRFYSGSGCLHSARVRSYLRTNGIAFIEVRSGTREFVQDILPEVGRWTVPVLATDEGDLICDGIDAIDALDRRGRSKFSIYPTDPYLLIVAHILELYGIHGLLRPAMYYRWFFEQVNAPFLTDMLRDYAPCAVDNPNKSLSVDETFKTMRGLASRFGVQRSTFRVIEDSFAQLLLLLESHLSRHRFMLGEHPTIADYGLAGPMLGYLARDPVPLRLLQVHAPSVYRWVERMNTAERVVDDAFPEGNHVLFAGSDIPSTLKSILHFIALDFLPEVEAHVDWTNARFRDGFSPNASSREYLLSSGKALGDVELSWRGQTISTRVYPVHLDYLQRLHDAIDNRNGAAIQENLAGLGFGVLLRQRLGQRAVQELLRDPL